MGFIETLVLGGKGLTLAQVMEVARGGRKVAISGEAAQRLADARALVFELADKGVPMYGCNTGVGWNKDIAITKEFLAEFNSNLLHSHAIGIEPYASEEETRAVLLVRLNTLLVGCTGLSPHIPAMYAELLNRKIHPLIPERGSVGQADIGCLSHVGLAMLGKGDVRYRGQVVPAADALAAEGLAPIELGAKDGLAIVSSNALSGGQAAVTLHAAKQLVQAAELVYCLSLEGFDGNTTPLDTRTLKMHGYADAVESASTMAQYLEGSYLYVRRAGKALQDPLCYRNGAHLYGAARRVVRKAEEMLAVQFNYSDDNPCLLLEERTVLSCSNFDPLPWVLEFEQLGIVLSHLSKAACLRILKLANPAFTQLSRNLTPSESTIAFSTIQKTFAALDAEIRQLATPVSMDTFPLAGEMEDLSSNAPTVVQNIRKIVGNFRYILSIELIFAGQALDLRGQIEMGRGTKAALGALRQAVPFYSKDDRALTADIYAANDLLKSGKLLGAVE